MQITFHKLVPAQQVICRKTPILIKALPRRTMPLTLNLPIRQVSAFTGMCSFFPKNLRFFGSPARPALGEVGR